MIDRLLHSHSKYNTMFMLGLPLVFLVLFLFPAIRETVTPFLLGAVLSYLLSPIVDVLNEKLYVPRFISIAVIFLLFIFLGVLSFMKVVGVVNYEVKQLSEDSQYFANQYGKHIQTLPLWMQSIGDFFIGSVRDLQGNHSVSGLPLVENIISRILHTFAFFVTLFYLLKDKKYFSEKIPDTPLYTKINTTLQNYFRGQLLLVTVMTLLTWIFLTILHVKFAFLLSLFTGFAELLPFIGPILAAVLSIGVIFFTQTASVASSVAATAIVVAMGYFIFRQLEDFFIMPFIISKSVELHPLVILFTTLLAGKLFGIIGLLMGVPFVACYKILLEEYLKER